MKAVDWCASSTRRIRQPFPVRQPAGALKNRLAQFTG